jgi:glyoxylase-like metal-dependent hydrolase (beta-lactamase superfamily II)
MVGRLLSRSAFQPAPRSRETLVADLTIDLEGHKLRVVEAGHSDTHDSSFLYVPSLELVIAGNICYNELHRWLVEATTVEKHGAALQKIAALKPATVIASHKHPGAVDGINNVYSTIEYIETFGKFKPESKSAEDQYHKMLARYPARINPNILWLGCQANFADGAPLGD